MSDTYIVELALDCNAIAVNPLTGCNNGTLYLPACNTKKGAVSTYTQFSLNATHPSASPDPDKIGFRIVDMTMISGIEPLQDLHFKSLHLGFHPARHQTHSSPFGDDHPGTAKFGPKTPTQSALFHRELDGYSVTFGNESYLPFENKGFFVVTYTLIVHFNGKDHTYRHDPEWIVDPF